VGGLRAEWTQSVGDGLNDTFDVLNNFRHPEPQHPKAHLAQPVISPRVVDELIAVVVAIDLEHKPCLQAGEVGEVWANRNLAAEFASQQLPAAQAVPEPPFGPGHLPPQHLGALIPSSSMETGLTIHGRKLSPLPGRRKSGR